jgi:hypothetical protein
VSWPLEALGCAPRALQRNFSAREDLLDALVDPHERVVWEVTDGFPPSRLVGHSRLLLVPSADRVRQAERAVVPATLLRLVPYQATFPRRNYTRYRNVYSADRPRWTQPARQ